MPKAAKEGGLSVPRLKKEMDRQGMKAHRLHTKLGDMLGRGARGTSYTAVRDLLKPGGTRHPRREVIEAIAEILSVNPEWLFGADVDRKQWRDQGDDALITAHAAQGWTELPEWTNRLAGTFEAAGWALPWVTFEMKASYTQTVLELANTSSDWPHIPGGLVDELASDVAWLVTLPLTTWGMQRPSQGRWLRDYVMASLHALRIALREPREGEHAEAHPESIVPRLRRTRAGDFQKQGK